YALMSEGSSIRRFGEGSVHNTIYFPEIRAFHIRLAPLGEQAEIVRIISGGLRRIDRLAEEAGTAAERLESLDRHIIALGFRGGLTSPEPADGSATELIVRLRPPSPSPAIVTGPRAKSRGRPEVAKSLEQVLRDARDWIP